ncbi:MAG: hypothetical protein AAE977_03790 [Thermoplasmataceae archaeon]|jgi:hypothetical protein
MGVAIQISENHDPSLQSDYGSLNFVSGIVSVSSTPGLAIDAL